MIEHSNEDGSALVVLHEQAPCQWQPRVVLRRNLCGHRAIERDRLLPARSILANLDTKRRSARDGQRILPRGVRQSALFPRLHVPGDLPAQVACVGDDSLFAEQLAVDLQQFQRVHPGKLADIDVSILFWCFGHSSSPCVNY